MRILFFASLRDEIGLAQLDLDETPSSVNELFAALASRLPPDAITSLQGDNVRIAVDQVLVDTDASLKGALEIAFLPPVTGG